ncbi:hypothetical protein SAMN05216264_11430 [Pseudomonas marincola]|nr:hypothetical protein [Pseudomonas marincola]SFU13843.1 hypothetical protein SAMN05216264_11430 [Pseudomonas marincola]
MTTIHRFLKELEVEEGDVWGELGSVNGKLASTVLELHNQLKQMVDSEISIMQARCDEAILEKTQIAQNLAQTIAEQKANQKAEKDRLSAEITNAKAMFEAEHHAHNDRRIELAEVREKLDSANLVVTDLKARLSNSERDVISVRQQLRHTEEMFSAKLESLQMTHDELIDRMRTENVKLNERLIASTNKAGELSGELSSVNEDLYSAKKTIAEMGDERRLFIELIQKKDIRLNELTDRKDKWKVRELKRGKRAIAGKPTPPRL